MNILGSRTTIFWVGQWDKVVNQDYRPDATISHGSKIASIFNAGVTCMQEDVARKAFPANGLEKRFRHQRACRKGARYILLEEQVEGASRIGLRKHGTEAVGADNGASGWPLSVVPDVFETNPVDACRQNVIDQSAN